MNDAELPTEPAEDAPEAAEAPEETVEADEALYDDTVPAPPPVEAWAPPTAQAAGPVEVVSVPVAFNSGEASELVGMHAENIGSVAVDGAPVTWVATELPGSDGVVTLRLTKPGANGPAVAEITVA